MRVAAAGNVAACRLDRDQLLPGPEPRRQFGLKLLNRGFLGFREFRHPVEGKPDVVLQLLRDLVSRCRDDVG